MIKNEINVLTNVIDKIKDSSLIAFDRINGSDYLIVLPEYDKKRLIEKCRWYLNFQVRDFISSFYIVPNALHYDLYDNLKKTIFDKIEEFIKKNI